MKIDNKSIGMNYLEKVTLNKNKVNAMEDSQ